MRFPDQILKCVVFLGRYISYGSEERLTWIGTAFLVRMESEHKGLFFTYLITAQHCADRLAGCKWFVRLNRKGGGTLIAEGATGSRWAKHPTESQAVDAALIPWGPPDDADVGFLPDSMFATDDVIAANKIGCGDEVAITGLFSKLTGEDQNHPMVRTGNIAMMPSEPLTQIKIGNYYGPATVYLVEARSLGGLSGSPVFVRQSVRVELPIPERTAAGEYTGEQLAIYAQARLFFLGCIHGHWEIRPEQQNDVNISSVQNRESVALGIAIVIPAKKILEILNQASFRLGREAANNEWREKGKT